MQHDGGRLPALQRPFDDAALEHVDHHGQIGKALLGSDVGDACHPRLVRRIDIDLSSQALVDDN